ncbi:MAG: hypothetical protein IJM33_07750 [Bacteroidales bacterium]|nr:hypothetical protein [Bacteroidales bacterium]
MAPPYGGQRRQRPAACRAATTNSGTGVMSQPYRLHLSDTILVPSALP